MSRICSIIVVLIAGSFITSCSSKLNYFSHHDKSLFTDNLIIDTNAISPYPYSVDMYSVKHQPDKPFDIIGQLSVSNYNQYGIKRQQAEVSRMLRFEAAALGGDAVINMGNRGNINYAEVVQFTS